MLTLMSRKAYARRRRQIIRQYVHMLGDVECDVGPGWLKLLSDTLDGIQKVLGDAMANQSTVVYAAEERDALRVIVELPEELSDARNESVQLILREAQRLSHKICRQCGASLPETGLGGPKECDRHDAFVGYFQEDLDVQMQRITSEGEGAQEENAKTESDSLFVPGNTTQQDLQDDCPRLSIYSVEDVKEIKRTLRQRTSDNDGRMRIQALCDDMITRGGDRPYCPLPEIDDDRFDRLALKFPNFNETINEFRSAVALARAGDGRLKLPGILLLGPPGIGKTLIAKEMAAMFDTEYVEIRMETEQNGSAITGSSEFWSNTQCGRIFDVLTRGRTANPFVTVDEVDKASGDSRYDPLGGLYSLLEEDTAKRFEDQSLRGLKIDASAIIWVLTANAIDPVPAPIRSRVQVHEIRAPDFDESVQIARSIYRALRETNAWGIRFAEELCQAAAEKLARHEPRKMRSLLLSAFGHAALGYKEMISPDDIPGVDAKATVTMGFI